MVNLDRVDFAQDPAARRYLHLFDDFPEAMVVTLRVLSDPDVQRRMIGFEHAGHPALGGAAPTLEAEAAFLAAATDPSGGDRFRQGIGVAARLVMEKLGWHKTGKKGTLGPPSAFGRAERYVEAPGTLPSAKSAHPADAAAFRAAEPQMLGLAARSLQVSELYPLAIALDDGSRVEVDGTDPDRTVLVEVYANPAALRGSQPHKVMADAVKLYTIRAATADWADATAAIVLFPKAAESFTGTGWRCRALAALAVDLIIVDDSDRSLTAPLHDARGPMGDGGNRRRPL